MKIDEFINIIKIKSWVLTKCRTYEIEDGIHKYVVVPSKKNIAIKGTNVGGVKYIICNIKILQDNPAILKYLFYREIYLLTNGTTIGYMFMSIFLPKEYKKVICGADMFASRHCLFNSEVVPSFKYLKSIYPNKLDELDNRLNIIKKMKNNK